MSIKDKLIQSLVEGKAKVEMFYDNGIVEPNSKGSHVVIAGTALFASVSGLVASAKDVSNYIHHAAGTPSEIAATAISASLIGGAAWVAMTTAAVAMQKMANKPKPVDNLQTSKLIGEGSAKPHRGVAHPTI